MNWNSNSLKQSSSIMDSAISLPIMDKKNSWNNITRKLLKNYHNINKGLVHLQEHRKRTGQTENFERVSTRNKSMPRKEQYFHPTNMD